MNIRTRLDRLEQRSGDNHHENGVKWAGGPPPMTIEEWEYFCTLSDEDQMNYNPMEGVEDEH